MSAYDVHCAIPRAMMTKNVMFLMRRSMREASRCRLHFVSKNLYFRSLLGTPLLNFIG